MDDEGPYPHFQLIYCRDDEESLSRIAAFPERAAASEHARLRLLAMPDEWISVVIAQIGDVKIEFPRICSCRPRNRGLLSDKAPLSSCRSCRLLKGRRSGPFVGTGEFAMEGSGVATSRRCGERFVQPFNDAIALGGCRADFRLSAPSCQRRLVVRSRSQITEGLVAAKQRFQLRRIYVEVAYASGEKKFTPRSHGYGLPAG